MHFSHPFDVTLCYMDKTGVLKPSSKVSNWEAWIIVTLFMYATSLTDIRILHENSAYLSAKHEISQVVNVNTIITHVRIPISFIGVRKNDAPKMHLTLRIIVRICLKFHFPKKCIIVTHS